MENGKPTWVKQEVDSQEEAQKRFGKNNVVKASSGEDGHFVSICLDQSKDNCVSCDQQLSCPVSMASKRR